VEGIFAEAAALLLKIRPVRSQFGWQFVAEETDRLEVKGRGIAQTALPVGPLKT
jgi:hypothetical protein